MNSMENIGLSMTRAIGSVWSVIIHTIIFAGAFALVFFGYPFERVLLVLTTLVSLEAIYLSIFIQMSVNHQAKALASVEKDIEDISSDVEDIAEDVEEIADDVEELQEDVEEIAEDVGEIQEDVEEIQEDVEEIAEEEEESTQTRGATS